jgi:hypothetical protein
VKLDSPLDPGGLQRRFDGLPASLSCRPQFLAPHLIFLVVAFRITRAVGSSSPCPRRLMQMLLRHEW